MNLFGKIAVILLLVALISTGFMVGNHLSYLTNRISSETYESGFDAGKNIGIQEGFEQCYNQLGMRWLGSLQRFQAFQEEYGSLHNTPWDKLTIQEKIVIAMYGGSGSKLNEYEMKELERGYAKTISK